MARKKSSSKKKAGKFFFKTAKSKGGNSGKYIFKAKGKTVKF